MGFTFRCHFSPGHQTLPDRPEKSAQTSQAFAPPSKHSFRVSQFLFLSDFEINHDLPLFHELANLRDQVYKELHLPTADNMVLVYVFEDRDKYNHSIHAKYPDWPK